MIRVAFAAVTLMLIIGQSFAQQPGRKYQDSNLRSLKNLFGVTTHDNESCAIRLYSYGETDVMLGVNYKAIEALLAYVDSQGRLTGEIAQYLLPVGEGGKFDQIISPGDSNNTFIGADKVLKYTWPSVPSEFNYNTWRDQGITYRRILSNWRRNPRATPADFETQCGPEARFCECIYNFPH